jgi:hypothetical protein
MKTTNLLRILGAASCLALANCATWPYENSHEAAQRDGEGYSLDNPATGSRYMSGADNTTTVTTTETTTAPGLPPETVTTFTETTPTSTTGSTPNPVTTVTPPPPPGPQPSGSPTYGVPVPGRRGFVYPPGVDPRPENMVDVRDFQPGQKVRDPRTGKIFLVP